MEKNRRKSNSIRVHTMHRNQDGLYKNFSRKLGIVIYVLMRSNGMNREELACLLNYSYRDVCRIIDGRLMLSPIEINKIAGVFGMSKEELIHYKLPDNIQEFKYINEFENYDSLNKIFNLMDDYVELIELGSE